MQDVKRKIKKAKVQLLLRNPFFATLLLSLPEREDPNLPFVMATDGTQLFYNPSEIEQLDLEELVSVLAHEALHVALLHPLRRGERDPKMWNVACDYAVNPLLKETGFTLPKGALLSDKYRNKYAEEIYADLMSSSSSASSQSSPTSPPSPSSSASSSSTTTSSSPSSQTSSQASCQAPSQAPQPQQTSSSQSSCSNPQPSVDPSGWGGVVDPAPGTNLRELESQLKQKIAAAYTMMKKEGRVPGGLEEEIKKLLYPKLPWSELLRKFFNCLTKDDYTFMRPNRRLLYRNLCFPSLYSPGAETVILAIDTSGSISTKELECFMSELNAILQIHSIKKLVIIQCDSKIQDVKEVIPPNPIPPLQVKGRGGTDFRPVFEYVEDHHLDPTCLIYLTDLECNSYPPTPPPYPVLWICSQKNFAPPPFGEVIVLK